MPSGLAKVLIKSRVQFYTSKSLFGKEYVSVFNSLAFAVNMFETGGILCANYPDKLDEFGLSFLGMTREQGSVGDALRELGNTAVKDIRPNTSFMDHVQCEFMQMLNYHGEPSSFLLSRGKEKMKPDTAREIAFQFTVSGAVVGAVGADLIKSMYETTYLNIDRESWGDWHKHGLNIPDEPDVINYSDRLNDENEIFIAYCKEFFPSMLG